MISASYTIDFSTIQEGEVQRDSLELRAMSSELALVQFGRYVAAEWPEETVVVGAKVERSPEIVEDDR